MKKILFIASFILFSLSLFGEKISIEKAKTAAINFLENQSNTQFKSALAINLTLVPEILPIITFSKKHTIKNDKVENPYYFIFNVNDNDGFVIISGDDATLPVLGYSYQGKIEIGNLPPAFIKWIEGYNKEIRITREKNIVQSDYVKNKWLELQTDKKFKNSNDINGVDPLITTKWNQSPYYNDMCPRKYFWSERAVTGCVATAMAQIMKYHNHPYQGTGFHKYDHSNNIVTYGTLSANFGATIYDWVNMSNFLYSGSTSSQKDAVSELMFHCGVSIDMDYHCTSDNQSAASTKEVANALVNYFQYDVGIEYVSMVDYYFDYGDDFLGEWIITLKNEINDNRPMQYRGSSQEGGGHSFVCDGYDNEDRFHFNFGWSGTADGFYLLSSLVPTETGTGAGLGEYTYGQSAIIGNKPYMNGYVQYLQTVGKHLIKQIINI